MADVAPPVLIPSPGISSIASSHGSPPPRQLPFAPVTDDDESSSSPDAITSEAIAPAHSLAVGTAGNITQQLQRKDSAPKWLEAMRDATSDVLRRVSGRRTPEPGDDVQGARDGSPVPKQKEAEEEVSKAWRTVE